jgi:hypothetical protein
MFVKFANSRPGKQAAPGSSASLLRAGAVNQLPAIDGYGIASKTPLMRLVAKFGKSIECSWAVAIPCKRFFRRGAQHPELEWRHEGAQPK